MIAVHSHFTFHIHIRNRNRNGMTYTKSKSNAIWERNGIVLRSGVMVLSSHISAAKKQCESNHRQRKENGERDEEFKKNITKKNTKQLKSSGGSSSSNYNTHTSLRWANNKYEYRTTIR